MLPRRRLLGGSLHEGIGLNFATGQYYVREQGRPANVQPLTSLFTFTGGNQSMYMGPGGLLVQSVTNTPRIEYDANGNCLGLLMEAARTNLCLQSQTLGTTWTTLQASISSNVTTAPDGTSTADKLVEDGTTNTHAVLQTFAKAASALTYTVSIFLKASERTACQLRFVDAAVSTNRVSTEVNLSTGALSSTAASGTFTSASATITALANGWYRVTLTGTTSTETSVNVIVFAQSPIGTSSYAGDGTSGLFAWGGQLEQAAFASSYIPTTTVAVARTADSCIRTLGSEFSATAGTVVVAGRASGGQDATSNQFVFTFGTGGDTLLFLRPATTNIARFNPFTGAVAQGPVDGTFVNSTAFKAGIAYASNDIALSFNGGAPATDATVTLAASYAQLSVGSDTASALQGNCHILRFDYWPTRLPNTYLVSAST